MKTHNTFFAKAFFIFLFTLTLTGYFSIQTKAQTKSPKISFEEIAHDFGKVKQGELLAYEYKFENNGEDTLVIKNVRASCGCTGATIGDKKNFGATEEGEIKVTFNTNGRSGNQSKTVYVQTNDPQNPQVILSFTCDIVNK